MIVVIVGIGVLSELAGIGESVGWTMSGLVWSTFVSGGSVWIDVCTSVTGSTTSALISVTNSTRARQTLRVETDRRSYTHSFYSCQFFLYPTTRESLGCSWVLGEIARSDEIIKTQFQEKDHTTKAI